MPRFAQPIILCLFFYYCRAESEASQERAKVVFTNPQYIKDVSIFTSRAKRGSPYLTSLNATLLRPWGNDLTMAITYQNVKIKSDVLTIELKTCDLLKMSWVQEWVKAFSDVSLVCPVPAGPVHFTGMELPPKNFPFLLSKNSEYEGGLTVIRTKTREKVLELTVLLKNHQKRRG